MLTVIMMSARIFLLCILSSVISTVASLKCQTCFTTGTECRNEDMQLMECGDDEKYCLTYSYRSTMTSPALSFTAKSCATAEQCSNAYYDVTSVARKHLQARAACCENDGCNTAPLPLPSRDTLKPNGRVCQGSYEQNGVSEPSGPVLCLGDEDQCISAKFSISALSAFSSTVNTQGCTTKNVCSYPIGKTKEANGLIIVDLETTECQNPEGLKRLDGFSRIFDQSQN